MAESPDKALEPSSKETEEHKNEEKKTENAPQAQEKDLESVGELVWGDIPDMPGIENAFDSLVLELREEIEKLNENLFGDEGSEEAIGEYMVETRDKLREYIDQKRNELSSEDLESYSSQLDLYSRICEDIDNRRHKEAMKLIDKLSEYGELPDELKSTKEECVIM
ncbi:unnamed protein product [Blepharisma stoltei]|uniref:Uncharacterized protein n=1 Tax=Blepharisma stoltei TaxID=1481888 RepID=A0AAU9JJ50_9CILI|nr:unnamed protein product [Blepharisma stoltei]